MRRLTVAFLWHMHQPAYVSLAEGQATLPWVRLHALKDYYDLAAIARQFPRIGQTFNLVPCLVDQIEAYAEGRMSDPFLDVGRRRVQDLTREDRLFLLREFFSYNHGTIGGRFPRLEELRRKRGVRPPEAENDAALAAWREPDYRDLQVLFHLAWSGRALSSRPLVASLINKGRGYSQEDLESLLGMQRAFVGEVLPEYARASDEGTIEISASPYYHPILPLLCDTRSALEATPRLPLPGAAFRHPDDARLQVRLARERLGRRFGRPPAGMWPSEGAISNEALGIMCEEGVRWTASDEDVLFGSLGQSATSSAERSRILHRPYTTPGGTAVFFRDHVLSDRIGFVYQSWNAEAAASDFVARLIAIADSAGNEPRVVSVILDGENPWEFYPEAGIPFLTALFGKLSTSDRIEARTFSSILADGPSLSPLPSVRAGSWIGAELTTWIGHPEKNRGWDLLSEARKALGPPEAGTPWGESLLAAEGSDWFWWYGDDHSSAHDADFDRTFRRHLQNAYHLAGREVPIALDRPIAQVRGIRPFSPPRGPVTPAIDGRAGDYFEWLAAGRADAELGTGTMSRAGRILKTLRFGIGAHALAIRLDTFRSPASAALNGLAAVIEFGAPLETRLRVPLVAGAFDDGGMQACLDRILELSIPFELLGAGPTSRFEFRLILEDADGKRLEAMPEDGVIVFAGGDEETDWIV